MNMVTNLTSKRKKQAGFKCYIMKNAVIKKERALNLCIYGKLRKRKGN